MGPLPRAFISISFTNKAAAGFVKNCKICQRVNMSNISQFETVNSWEERLKTAFKRYEDLFGITKLTQMHDNVLKAQAKVSEVQQKRRKVQEDILMVQNNLQEIQSKLEKIPRGDDMFLSVVTQEHELIKQQKYLQSLLAVCDQTEREEQTALALAINNSQDHEKTYREKNKYISLIAGVVGGCVGVIGSSINNWRHRKDIKLFSQEIKHVIEEHNSAHGEKIDRVCSVMNKMDVLSEHLDEFRLPNSGSKSIFDQLESQTHNLLGLVNVQQEVLSNIAQDVDAFIKSDIDHTIKSFYSELFVKKILQDVNDKMDRRFKFQSYATAFFLSSSLLLTSIIFYVVNQR